MDTSLIKVMTSQLHNLNVNIKEVKVDFKPHPKAEQKQCFNNSFRHVLDHPDSTYVLGYYLYMGHIPLEHAWVKENDHYYDVTLDKKKAKPGDAYISVVELSFDQVSEYVNENGHAPDLFAMNRFMGKKKS